MRWNKSATRLAEGMGMPKRIRTGTVIACRASLVGGITTTLTVRTKTLRKGITRETLEVSELLTDRRGAEAHVFRCSACKREMWYILDPGMKLEKFQSFHCVYGDCNRIGPLFTKTVRTFRSGKCICGCQ